MGMRSAALWFPAVFLCSGFGLSAQVSGRLNPTVQTIVGEISTDRIAETMKKLQWFETRGNFTDPAQENRGIGAARRWIYDQFRSYSPRLEVSFDAYKVKKQGRIFRDVEIVNVVAVLPGTSQRDRRVLVTGHYDSLNIIRKSGAPDEEDGGANTIDYEKSADAPAPGVSDDASGTAAVMELARAMSQQEFEKTVVFVAFAGEEIGLVGSSLYAEKAKQQHQQIEAVLNNDVIGNDVAGDGRMENRMVHVFSSDPADSLSRELARYVKECADRYVPGMRAETVFRADRFARGGDHTPFEVNGFAAVRFTTPAENLKAQHSVNDTFANASPAYTGQVARVNAATLASLALAPQPPNTTRVITSPGPNNGRIVPNLSRGKSRYDAVLRWKDPNPVEDLAGYAVVLRATTSPFWEREIFVGKTNQYTFSGVSIDDIVIGVKAIDNSGNQSLVAPFVAAPYPYKKIELAEDGAKVTDGR